MKSKLLFMLMIAFVGTALVGNSQTPNDAIKLSDKVSIQFPEKPITQDMGPAKLYNLRLEDSSANFLALATDLQKSNGLDAATLSEASMQPEFWDQAEQGFISSMGESAKLVSREMKNITGIDVMQIVITRVTEKGETNTVTVWIFVEDIYSINLIHTNRAGKADEKKRDAFFASVEVD